MVVINKQVNKKEAREGMKMKMMWKEIEKIKMTTEAITQATTKEKRKDPKENTMKGTKGVTKDETMKNILDRMVTMLIELNKKGVEMAMEERMDRRQRLNQELREMKLKWRKMKKIDSIEKEVRNQMKEGLSNMWLELTRLNEEIKDVMDKKIKTDMKTKKEMMCVVIKTMLREVKTNGAMKMANTKTNGSMEVAEKKTNGPMEVAEKKTNGIIKVVKTKTTGPMEVAEKKTNGIIKVVKTKTTGPMEVAEKKTNGIIKVVKTKTTGPMEVAEKKTNGIIKVVETKTNGPMKKARKKKTVDKKAIRRIQSDLLWRKLSLAQRRFMDSNPQTRCTEISDFVYEAVFANSISKLQTDYDFSQITENNFRIVFELLISAEEAWEHTDMRKHDMKLVEIDKTEDPRKKGKFLYLCRVPGLSRGQPSLIPTDGLIMDDGSTRYPMTIVDIDFDLLTFEPKNSKVEVLLKSNKCDISFVPSGICYDRFLGALETVGENRRFREILFGEGLTGQNSREPSAKIDFCISGNKELDKRFASLNARQKQAIIHILEAKCRPNLYILFGPPGTGKTFTLVETVVQIYNRNKRSKILVCSSSNTCVDSIASTIYGTRQVDSMIRFSSRHHYDKLLRPPNYFTDTDKDTASHRVVITTNTMVSKLPFKIYFDYVLVDEAGHAHVLETLVPMTRLQQDGCLVLAGDPRQLGPVIKSFEVERLGLGKSLLERMCERDLYQRRNGQYDEKYITKLVESYRCDPNILGVCNNLFYHGDLECLGRTPPSLLKILNVEKPLIFVTVAGQEKTPGTSTSRCNKIEAKECIKTLIQLYKMGVEPEQVGVITPYLLQKEMLSNILKEEIKKEGPLLDERFKMPQVSTKSDKKPSVSKEKPTLISSTKMNGSNIGSGKLNDIDFLTNALTKMKLEAQKKQEARTQGHPQRVPPMDWLCKIDTVDAFQGSERPIIIVSTVRSPDNDGELHQSGFLADAKRFNVTISRAKWLVIVIGHPIVLDCCKYWKQFNHNSFQVKSILNHL